MADTDIIKLPKKPIYQMLYDGAGTRKIIDWVKRLEGDPGDIDVDDPILQAILTGLSLRIKSLEDFVDGMPDLQNVVSRVLTLETTTTQEKVKLQTAIQDITSLLERLGDVESDISTNSESIIQLDTKILAAETTIQNIQLLIQNLTQRMDDIIPITNEEISKLFE